MLLTVLVPTFRRAERLNLCLSGIHKQVRKPDQVLITVRHEDYETVSLLRTWESKLTIHQVRLDRPGVIAAMNAGCAEAIGDIICLTDDDAVPRPDWLRRIEAYFAEDPKLGALGGRDVNLPHKIEFEACEHTVGIISPLGRIVGNHHLALGEARVVDHLKGVNMSWRKAAALPIPFSEEFRGSGAQVNFELGFCWDIQRRGWKILFDPTLQIDHYPAVRHDDDNRGAGSIASQQNAAFNLYFCLFHLRRKGPRRTAALLWTRLVGTNGTPGILRTAVAMLTGSEQRVELGRAMSTAWREARQAQSPAAL